jgi:NTP pyrophosphatase (non-canonical NTP hydrolase)
MASDRDTTIFELKRTISDFVSERDWDQYHRPKDVAMALSIEAGELMELYLWDRRPERDDLQDELGDLLFFLVDMAIRENIDLVEAFHRKMEKNNLKYPASMVKGKDDKYTSYRGAE